MTSKSFVTIFLCGIALVAALVVGANVYIDLYGLFRPSQHRALSVYGEERSTKYLHSLRYIPEKFDGVLLGSSVSEGLNTRDLPGFRVYNASINGGNIQDLKPIAENLYSKGNFRLSILCAHRYITNNHTVKTDLMTPRQYWGALGSPQLLTAYISRIAIGAGVASRSFDDYGIMVGSNSDDASRSEALIARAVDDIGRGTAAVGDYHIDPVAMREFAALVRVARQHSRQLAVFYPPVPSRILAVRKDEVAHYRAEIESLLQPSDTVVDFNSPKYADFRENYRNFSDAVHLSKRGSATITAELGEVVSRAQASR